MVRAEKWPPGRRVHAAGPLPGRGSRSHLQPPGLPVCPSGHMEAFRAASQVRDRSFWEF